MNSESKGLICVGAAMFQTVLHDNGIQACLWIVCRETAAETGISKTGLPANDRVDC